MNRWAQLVVWCASGFGLGLSPVASGTVGTLPGVLLAIAIALVLPLPAQIVVCVLLALLAVPICDVAERHYGRKDDGRIVADEYLTFPICVLGLPLEPWVFAIAFLTARVMDVLKIPPARQSQNLKGGLGIVLDDVIASLYALALNHAIVWGARHFFVL